MAQRSKMAPERIRHRIACQHLRASLPGLMLRGERGSIAQNKASAARISMGNKKNTVSSIFLLPDTAWRRYPAQCKFTR
ncbi:hypothetical protein ACFS07_00150 [Undibacterium arcticum]